jgi:NADH-quinone oxidoreductase subunit I
MADESDTEGQHTPGAGPGVPAGGEPGGPGGDAPDETPGAPPTRPQAEVAGGADGTTTVADAGFLLPVERRYGSRRPGVTERVARAVWSPVAAVGVVFAHAWRRRDTIQYPDEIAYFAPRYRGRIILSRDPDGGERCVACYLCSAACPVDCIALQATEDEHGRRYPAWFRINFSRCIYCGLCEEACPTYAIQLTPDVEMCEYERSNMVYEKEDLLISGTGKYHDYDFYRVAGLTIDGKGKGEAEHEAPPTDVHDILP